MAETPILNGQLRFVGDEDGASKPVLLLYNVSMAPAGDFDYISEDFAQLSFEAAVMKSDEGYAKEYFEFVKEYYNEDLSIDGDIMLNYMLFEEF